MLQLAGHAVIVRCGYTPIDRDELATAPEGLDEAEARARATLSSRPTLRFSPSGREETAISDVDEVVDAVTAARHDIDWIEGFRRGLADAARAERGQALVGPGISKWPRSDGWTPSLEQRKAYERGFERGTS